VGKVDRYVLFARLAPAAIVVLPIVVTAGAWLEMDVLSARGAAASLVWLVLSTALAQFGRDAGKKKEPMLFEIWDGRPSTQLLRSSNRDLSAATRGRYRAAIGRLMPEMILPTEAEESANPVQADAAFDAVGDVLRERTRDRVRFRVLFSENVSYGFRRNMWGLKIYGLVLATLGSVACAVLARVCPGRSVGIAGAANAALAFYWFNVVDADWVRVVAFEYAKRLLATLDTLTPSLGSRIEPKEAAR
jgi:hypothetical protein